MSATKIKAKGQVIDLNQNHYKGAGGEGTIYVKGGYAYKIYHDPSKTIPVGKIRELAPLSICPNILGPQFPITDTKDAPVGFAMAYKDKTEYLCKLFTKGFRDDNNVSPSDINALVKNMQDTLRFIHKNGILVVDYNELNFLMDEKFSEVYYIDVDCYQTKTYPATAIMESIRDPKSAGNKFTEGSDWFSAAIIFSQLYLGTHPYKGRHPDYGKNWQEMMKAGVSIFNKATRMPPNTQDFAVVPKGHLKWLEAVLEHGDRTAPPEPDQVDVAIGKIIPQIVDSTSKFSLTLAHKYDADILAFRFINGVGYAYTKNGIYADGRQLRVNVAQSGFIAKRVVRDFVPATNDSPVLIEFNPISQELTWTSFNGSQTGTLNARSFFVLNEKLYIENNGSLLECSFVNFGKRVIMSQQNVGNVFQSYVRGSGVLVQDILGKCHVSIPTKVGAARSIPIKELDKNRILGARHEKGILVVIAEQAGVLSRHTVCFNKAFESYTIRSEVNATLEDIQLVVLDKGLCVTSNDDNIEIFFDNAKIKVVDDSPITNSQRLYSTGNNIYLVNKGEVYKVGMK